MKGMFLTVVIGCLLWALLLWWIAFLAKGFLP